MSLRIESRPGDFARALRGELGGRAWLVRDEACGGYAASSPRLQPLADFLSGDRRDVRGHEAIFLEVGRGTGAFFAAVLHDTRRGQGQGGVRHWPYETVEGVLRDGLRLAQAMTRKNALARLWWGGGKGIIAQPPGDRVRDPDFRRALFQEYGGFVTGLRGCYVTGEDVGTGPSDMAEVFRTTRFATCIPPERGGSGNPSTMTAEGVAVAMEAALETLGHGSLEGKKVALQGVGQVGSVLVRLLLERGVAGVVASDVVAERCEALLDLHAGEPVTVRRTEPGDLSIVAEECDVLAPCALGGVVNPKTIPDVRAKLVCGAANNPLEDDARDAKALAERGIAYVPDFVANRMGIVSCANEMYGSLQQDPAVRRHLDPSWEGGIAATTRRILETAQAKRTTALAEALRLADELAEEPHPIWAHRSWRIIQSLTQNGWMSGR